MKAGNTRWYLSVALGLITALLALILLIGTLIPQLVQSISGFAENFDGYAVTLINILKGSPLEAVINAEKLQSISQNAMISISGFVSENAGKILSAAADSGKGILSTVISLIVAVYLLIGKNGVLEAWWRFMNIGMRREKPGGVMDFIRAATRFL